MLIRSFLIVGLSLYFSSAGYAQETLVIAGAGPSTKIVGLFFQNFAKQPAAEGYTFVVPEESAKHAGGIRHSFKNLFGRTGRPLNDKEREFNRREIFLAKMPVSIVTGRGVKVSRLTMSELEGIFQKRISNWKKVGGPDTEIVTVGREPTEALFSELKRFYTFFRNAEFDMILNKDHEVVEFLDADAGRYAISFGAKANLNHLNIVDIAEELDTGVRLGLVYDAKNEQHPLVRAVRRYAESDEWKKNVRGSGAYPLD